MWNLNKKKLIKNENFYAKSVEVEFEVQILANFIEITKMCKPFCI